MKIGMHVNESDILNNSPVYSLSTHDGKNVDFLLCHMDPAGKTMEENRKNAGAVAKKLKETDENLTFICNFEQQNFAEDMSTPDGFDWANREDGTHRSKLPKEYVDALNSENNCDGFMYDEFEHCIINRNMSIALASKFKKDLPVFVTTGNSSLKEQSDLLDKQLKEYTEEIMSSGIKSFSGEHVYPVLYHRFAKSGIIPNYKGQKESCTNIQFAIAAGAALEYGTPLWCCVDLWLRMTFPGHSAKEMYSNLLFNWLMGVDRVYVEAAQAFITDGKANEYAAQFDRFAMEYKGKDRGLSFRDYKPETGIIRCDDSFWGQGTTPLLWPDMLLGNPKLKIRKKSREWVQAFNIITRGETGNGGLSYGRISPALLKKHRSFVSMNGAVVFDENVKKENLESLKLLFLCGEYISEETLDAVAELVNSNGLTVVTTPTYAPGGYNCSKSVSTIKQGKGKWIVTDSFKNPILPKILKPLLGNKGEMHFRLGDEDLRMKISDDGETFDLL